MTKPPPAAPPPAAPPPAAPPPAAAAPEDESTLRLGTPIVKSPADIARMRQAGRVVAATLQLAAAWVRPGTVLRDLDALAFRHITDRGARPSFLGYCPPFAQRGYPASVCLSVNDVILHGIPDDTVLVEGDLLSIDCGACLNGFHADAATTLAVGAADAGGLRLVEATRAALDAAIGAALVGTRLTDLSRLIAATAARHECAVVPDFGGHGIGRDLHEDPHIPNDAPAGLGPVLQEGMAFAIEPIFAERGGGYRIRPDGWTVETRDHSRAAHFEHTVAITEAGPEVLTALDNA
jgi:methionyl aminopeptidase